MPTGVIANASAVALGGIIGILFKNRINKDLKYNLNLIFGLCSMAMGITNIILMQNMPAVILSVILGTAVGLYLRLSERISNVIGGLLQYVKPKCSLSTSSEDYHATLLTVFVLFCASGIGIYGAIVSGMSGDQSILLTKSILDFFAALIFACILGTTISVIAIFQGLIFLLLFLQEDSFIL